VWITGLPSSGKSTLARRIQRRLEEAGRAALVLDGDEVRAALVPAPGYAPEARDAFYATLARLAALAAAQGLVVVVPATAHRAAYRAEAKRLAPAFVEVHVDVGPEECSRRDAKGLYAAARAGRAEGLPGADLAYEPPSAPHVVASGGADERAAEQVLALIGETDPPDAEQPPPAPR
jgi:adenylylsulfate kinase